MAKFANAPARRAVAATRTGGPVYTYEGGLGFREDTKTALFTLAVTNMVGEATFYEAADVRDKRFTDLVHAVTVEDPEWMQAFIPWLRDTANMRSASVAAACEYVKAGGPNGRRVIAAACQRADEPAEVIGYWLSKHGRNIPKPVKRGVADAAVRLYTERAVLKYDTNSRAIRFADVIELTHAKPKNLAQSALFRHAIERRHGRGTNVPGVLSVLANAENLAATPEDQRRGALRVHGARWLSGAGFTWERLSGWLPGGMDAEAWEAVIPSMGYMALLRNLRNFEEAGISDAAVDAVSKRLMDPTMVAGSRQFPFRMYSAWLATQSMTWGRPLERALDLSLANVPALPGRTLVMVDTSGSMTMGSVSARSTVTPAQAAAVFGAALASRGDSDLYIYADHGAPVQNPPRSVLRSVDKIRSLIGSVGHGTYTWPSVRSAYNGHDRVIVLTDMQDHPARQHELPNVPVYVWDLKGYGRANVDTSTPGRYLFGGFSDAAFKVIPLLERGRDSGWPWEVA